MLFTMGQHLVAGRTNSMQILTVPGADARRRRVPEPTRKALVLPGAGARGAYQVGVLKAIAEHPAEARAESVQRHLRHVGRRDQRRRARGPRRATSSAPSRDMEHVWGNFAREPGLSRRQLDDAQDEPALARRRDVRRARRAQPGVAARQRAAARAADARRAFRRHRARDRAGPSRRRRGHRFGVRDGAVGDVLPRPAGARVVDARAPHRPRRRSSRSIT